KNRIAHRLFLIAASFFFYGYWNWRFTFLLFACCLGNYVFSMLLQAARKRASGFIDDAGSIQIKRSTLEMAVFIFAMVYNLGILVFFKYYLFFTVNANNLLLAFGAQGRLPILPVVLPVGISFFTFQGMSYTIDVYRRRYPASRSLLNVLLYISFFPQLVAGPIVRAGDFLPQLDRSPDPRKIETGRALVLIIGGLIKKVFIAQYLAVLLVDPVFADPLRYSWLECLLGVYGYAFQIFCDFSAYSDIAIGVAALLGYHFPANFNKPYSAGSIQDFWRRWHISLSTWLKDYLYVSLGGSRKGKFKTYRTLGLTMILGGLWHGAAWNFIFWGALHGSGLIVERRFKEAGVKRRNRSRENGKLSLPGAGPADSVPPAKGIFRIIRIVAVFNFVCLGWIFFRSSSFRMAWDFIRTFGNGIGTLSLINPLVIMLLVVGMGIHFVPAAWEEKIRLSFGKFHWVLQAAVLVVFIFFLSATSPEGAAPFIYFQF
ncbi:MAG: MBOAT family protein, partial [Spirochaetales bacterium]